MTIVPGTSRNCVEEFTYLSNKISSFESSVNTRISKAWGSVDMLSLVWKSKLPDNIKRNLFEKLLLCSIVRLLGIDPYLKIGN